MRAKEFGAAHLRGRCHGTPFSDGFKFPHHSAFMPSSLLTSISIAVSSFTLSSDQFLFFPLLGSSVGHFKRVRPAWSGTRGLPGPSGPLPELVRGTLDMATSPANPLLSSSQDVTCSGRGAPGLRSLGRWATENRSYPKGL